MMDRENESFADWLFYARKHRQRRTIHTTHSSQNTQENE